MKKTIKTIGFATLATLALVGCGGGGGGSDYTAHPYDAPAIDEGAKAQYLNAINTARATGRSCGSAGEYPAAPAVSWSDGAYKAAYEHSEDMASSNTWSHIGSGTENDWTAQVQGYEDRGSLPFERMQNNGGGTDEGEVLAAGTTSINTAVNAWLASDNHCASLMNANSKVVGIALVENSSSTYKAYWTGNFGS